MILTLAFLVGLLDFGIRRSNFGLEIFRLNQSVVQLHFFVLIAELLQQLVGAGAHAIRYQPAELFFQETLLDQVLKDGNRHAESLLHLLRVLVHPYWAVAIKSCRQELFYAIGDLFIGDFNPQAVCFVLNFFCVHQLRQNLSGVKPFEWLRYLIATLNFTQLLAYFGQRDGLVPDLCHGVVGSRVRCRSLRHQVQEHADRDHADENPDENPDKDLSIVPSSSHP